MYFVQGILGLARLALTYFFKDELHLDPVRLTLASLDLCTPHPCALPPPPDQALSHAVISPSSRTQQTHLRIHV